MPGSRPTLSHPPHMKLHTREEYDATEALNYSGLRELLKSPLHYQTYRTQPREDSKALRIGSATHALALQGAEAYAAGFAIAPELDRRTSAGKQAWAEFQTENAGKVILTDEEGQLVRAVALAARAAIAARGIVAEAAEVMYVVDYCGTPIKAALDLIGTDADGHPVIVDLKTTEDASEAAFLGSVRSYRYNLQRHTYRTVYNIERGDLPRFLFLAVEKGGANACAWYEIGANLAAYAVEDFERGVKLYADCTAAKAWPGYPTEARVLDIGAPAKAATSITFA